MMTRFNIAILTHNALEYTRKCLASIALCTPFEHSIFIVDNASTDGTREWLSEQTADNMHIELSRSNLGVPGGRNLLIYRIIPEVPDDALIIFLDNDVEVYEGWYEPFLELFERQPRVGIAGATGHRIIVHAEERELLPAPEESPEPVDVVTGYCFWVTAEVVCAVGLFDENLGLFWHEDDDYCIRAIKLGYEVFAVPNAALWHHGHKSGVVAVPVAGGSSENQRYLAKKWRELGVVDAEGRIIRGRQ